MTAGPASNLPMDRRTFDISDTHDIIAILDADQAVIKCSDMRQGIPRPDAEDDDAYDLSKARPLLCMPCRRLQPKTQLPALTFRLNLARHACSRFFNPPLSKSPTCALLPLPCFSLYASRGACRRASAVASSKNGREAFQSTQRS